MKVLALLGDRAAPPVSGVRVRNYHLWPAVQREVDQLQILSLDLSRDRTSDNGGAPGGPPGCDVRFFRHVRQALPLRAVNAIRYSYHQWPRSSQLADAVDEIVQRWRPDVVHAEELRMAWYLPLLRGRSARNIVQTVTFHNVETDLLAQTGSTALPLLRPLIARAHRRSLQRYERFVAESVDRVFAYSPVDRRRLESLYPSIRCQETRGGADVSGVVPQSTPLNRRVLIPGSLSYAPNIEGILWFLREVLPLLPRDLEVMVAGSGAGASIRGELSRTHVSFVDTPPSLAPLYAQHAVCAIPLLSGGGTRGRILESLAHGRLVVTTSKGVEGLELSAADGVVVADDASGFAKALQHWTRPSADRDGLIQQGRQKIARRYDWPVVAAELVTEWRGLGRDAQSSAVAPSSAA